MVKRSSVLGLCCAFSLLLSAPPLLAAGPSSDSSEPDRTRLPIASPDYPCSTILDARDAVAPPQFQVKAPAQAPNVIIILIDDMGFGQSSAFGGPIQMPTLEKLAKKGLKYNNFHTTALCSPTRAALLTGRNHHQCNMGSITETATAFPGQTGRRPESVAPLASMLRLNGYSTGAFGKSHETAAWEVSPSGPTDRWPTRSGFDKFYGFIGGEANQWAPTIYDGLTQVEPPADPNYHFTKDMTNKAIDWMKSVKSLTPEKPVFMYFAPGATHAPHHVPAQWIAKYRGKFDQGWDRLREETLARQKKLGIVPADAVLANKPKAIKDWDKLSDAERKLFARQMEVFAGYGEYTDHEIARLIEAVEELGQMENTLIFYIAGDNGASAEGGFNGLFNEMSYFNNHAESVDEILKHLDQLGGPDSYGHYAAGWAVAGDTPFTWTKQIASDYGGTTNGMVVHWPRGIQEKTQLRSQFHHVIDIAPTILEAAGLPQPKSVNGVTQTPIEGVSMIYSFNQPEADSKRKTQYFEIFGNRSIYHDGWLAGTVHKEPWEMKPKTGFAQDRWELYDTRKDFSLSKNLAEENPEKLKELQALFLKEASRNHALPLDDRFLERVNAATVGRPDLMAGRKTLELYNGMSGITENAFLDIKNRSFTIDAEIEIPKAAAEGAIIAQAGKFGGWSLYLKESRPKFTYNFLGHTKYEIESSETIPSGKASLRFVFEYDGGGLGKGGNAILSVNGKEVARGRIEQTQSFIFSADEGADVGADLGTAVGDYQVPFRFNGNLTKVTLSIEALKSDEKAEHVRGRASAALKKAISD